MTILSSEKSTVIDLDNILNNELKNILGSALDRLKDGSFDGNMSYARQVLEYIDDCICDTVDVLISSLPKTYYWSIIADHYYEKAYQLVMFVKYAIVLCISKKHNRYEGLVRRALNVQDISIAHNASPQNNPRSPLRVAVSPFRPAVRDNSPNDPRRQLNFNDSPVSPRSSGRVQDNSVENVVRGLDMDNV
jgi:hypothetical protein